MFESVLVANRGEIAVRVMRTLRRLGVRSIAVFSDADAGARHVREADTAYRLGPARASESYLSIERLLDAARATGAEAVHPGYGFLAENAEFARACATAGLVFVGPPAEAIELMGDKIRAKRWAQAAGVPVVAGSHEAAMTDAQIAEAARDVGFPVLLKPSAGGGGKGMRLVRDTDTLLDEIEAARREARAAFGDDALLVERFVEQPRHIEIQVLADTHGTVVHLGERECSLQRRHQKIVEEAPSPLLDTSVREVMGASAVALARSCGYVGAGTVEFVVPDGRPQDYQFIEMNTRLQVEHPVTEQVCAIRGRRGVDLVEQQLRVAAGEPLGFDQSDIAITGHAIEARVYAEDPENGFLPTGGQLLALREPSDIGGPELIGDAGVRVDSGLLVGSRVTSDYDPMLAKVIAWDRDRDGALRRLRAALGSSVVLGLTTNIGFLIDLLGRPDVVEARLDTGLVDRVSSEVVVTSVPDEVLVAAAAATVTRAEEAGADEHGWRDPFDRRDGWRVGVASGGPAAWSTWHLRSPGRDPVRVRLRGAFDSPPDGHISPDPEAVVGDGEPMPVALRRIRRPAASGTPADILDVLDVTVAGVPHRFTVALEPENAARAVWLARAGRTWVLREVDSWQSARRAAEVAGRGTLVAPMPGTVTVVKVSPGDHVTAGQTLLIVEAMKMEHVIAAPVAGTVTALHVSAAQSVAMDDVLAVVEPLSPGEAPEQQPEQASEADS